MNIIILAVLVIILFFIFKPVDWLRTCFCDQCYMLMQVHFADIEIRIVFLYPTSCWVIRNQFKKYFGIHLQVPTILKLFKYSLAIEFLTDDAVQNFKSKFTLGYRCFEEAREQCQLQYIINVQMNLWVCPILLVFRIFAHRNKAIF